MNKRTFVKRFMAVALAFAMVFTTGAFNGVVLAAPPDDDTTSTMKYQGYSLTYTLDKASSNATVTKCEKDTAVTEDLLEVEIPDDITYQGEKYDVVSVSANAFSGLNTIKMYTFGENVDSVEAGALDLTSAMVLRFQGKSFMTTFGETIDTTKVTTIVRNEASKEKVVEAYPAYGDDGADKDRIVVNANAASTRLMEFESANIADGKQVKSAQFVINDVITGKQVNNITKKLSYEVQSFPTPLTDEFYVSNSAMTGTDYIMFSKEITYVFEAENYISISGKMHFTDTSFTVNGFRYNALTEPSSVNGTVVNGTVELIDTVTALNSEQFDIPETVQNGTKTYQVVSIGDAAFAKIGAAVHSYYIPKTIKKIGANAFPYNADDATKANASNNQNTSLVLRFGATSESELPALGYIAPSNNARLAILVNKPITVDQAKNKLQVNTNFVYAVDTAKSAKIMYGGSVNITGTAFYGETLAGDLPIAIGTAYKDFVKGTDIASTVAWDINPVFTFALGVVNAGYTVSSTGYESVKESRSITPITHSGFSYELSGATLLVTGYAGAEKEIAILPSESDGTVYPISGIKKLSNSNVTKLTIPTSVTSIADGAFNGSTYMVISVVDGNAVYKSMDGWLYKIDGKTLLDAPSASGDVIVPEGVTVIGNNAFKHNSKVQSIILPSSLTNLGTTLYQANCFAGARQLETIKFSGGADTLNIMGNNVLSWAIKNIYVPTGTSAAYTAKLSSCNHFSADKLKEWNPTYNTIITMDGKETYLATPSDSTKSYTWTSSDPNVAVVEPVGVQGKIIAVGNGRAVITATAADGTSYKWTVDVTLSAEVYAITLPTAQVTLGKKSGKNADWVALEALSVPRQSTIASVSSSNKKVATVTISKKGKVWIKSGKKAGTATITVTNSDGKSTTVKVKVTKKTPTKVKLKKKAISLKKGKTYGIKISSLGSKKAKCAHFTYKSSKKKIASVDENGIVTAKKKGTAVITITTYNGKKAKLKVTVKK